LGDWVATRQIAAIAAQFGFLFKLEKEICRMIIRLVTYHALDDKDVERWMQTSAAELRSVKGMRHLEFIRSKTNSSQYGAIMHFRTIEDLDNYKRKESGTYQTLVRSIRETWMDDTKPVSEQVFEILDI